MTESTLVPILTAIGLKEDARPFVEGLRLGWVAISQPLLYPCVVFIALVIPLVELIRFYIEAGLGSFFGANRLDHAHLSRDRIVAKNDSLTKLTLRELVVILEVIWVVVGLKSCLLLLRWHHLLTLWIHHVRHLHRVEASTTHHWRWLHLSTCECWRHHTRLAERRHHLLLPWILGLELVGQILDA